MADTLFPGTANPSAAAAPTDPLFKGQSQPKTNPKAAIETIAKRNRIPVNYLFAATEAAGATTPEEQAQAAEAIAERYAPRIAAGENIKDIVRSDLREKAEPFIARAQQIAAEMYPAQWAEKVKKIEAEGGGVGAALGAGVDMVAQGYGSAVEGLGRVTGLEGVEDYGNEIAAVRGGRVNDASQGLKTIEDIGGVGDVAQFTGEQVAQNAPQMATSMGGAAVGAAVGSFFPVVGTGVGALIGGLAVNLPFFYGMNRERQKQEGAPGEKVEVSEGAAALTAIPQAALDTIVDKVLMGMGPTPAIMEGGGIFTRAAKGVVGGVVVETPTEVGQQLLERMQAGLPIADDEAIKEYRDTAIAAGLIGGTVGGVTNAATKPKGQMREVLETGLNGNTVRPALPSPTNGGTIFADGPVSPPPEVRDPTQFERQPGATRAPKGEMGAASTATPGPLLGAPAGTPLQITSPDLEGPINGVLSNETPLAVTVTTADGEVLEIPRGEIEAGAVSITLAQAEETPAEAPTIKEGTAPVITDAPVSEESAPVADKKATPADTKPLPVDTEPPAPPANPAAARDDMTAEQARARLAYLQDQARTNGWDARLRKMHDDVAQIVARFDKADQDAANAASGIITKKDGTPFKTETQAKRALGNLGYGVDGYDIVPQGDGFVAAPRSRTEQQDGSVEPLSGVQEADVDVPKVGARKPRAPRKGPSVSPPAGDVAAPAAPVEPAKPRLDVAPMAPADTRSQPDMLGGRDVPENELAAKEKRRREWGQYLGVATHGGSDWDGELEGRAVRIRRGRVRILAAEKPGSDDPILDAQGMSREEVSGWTREVMDRLGPAPEKAPAASVQPRTDQDQIKKSPDAGADAPRGAVQGDTGAAAGSAAVPTKANPAAGKTYRLDQGLSDKQRKTLAKARDTDAGEVLGEIDNAVRRAALDLRADGVDIDALDDRGRDASGRFHQMGVMVREGETAARDLLEQIAEAKGEPLDFPNRDEDTGEWEFDGSPLSNALEWLEGQYAMGLGVDEVAEPGPNSRLDGDTTPMPKDQVFPAGKGTVSLDGQADRQGFIPQAEADARIAAWKKVAADIGKTDKNKHKVVISIFDYTGAWAQPWRDAGYTILQHDIKTGSDLLTDAWISDRIEEVRAEGFEVYGVLSACPCTTFAGSGARWWQDLHDKESPEALKKVFGDRALSSGAKSPVEYNVMLVDATRDVVELAAPTGFHVLENPIGRIETAANLPPPKARFHPYNFGNPYTKRTQLFGDFQTDLPFANVDPVEGSKMQSKHRGDDPLGKEARSTTPEGFAYAFFMANDPEARKQKDGAESAAPQPSVVVPTARQVAAAAAETDRNPTDAQKEAENYETGKIQWNGLTLSIENAKGSDRAGFAGKMPPVRDGYVRLYRGQGPNKVLPEWITEGLKQSGATDVQGRWFTDSLAIALWYVRDAGDDGYLSYVDVPRATVKASAVADNDTARRFSRDPDNEFLIPREWAEKAAKTPADPWVVTMPAHYGRILRTEGADGDHVDFYMGPRPDSDLVVVVDQKDEATGQFDEHKVMLGFANRKAALDFYVQGFSDGKGADRMGGHKIMTVAEFKDWLANGDQTAPVRTNAKVKPETGDDTKRKAGDPEQAQEAPTPKGEGRDEGRFGPVLTGYAGDWKAAALALEERQSGEATAALSHPEVGDIALVWGEPGTGRSDGFGLSKILAWHPEVLDDLQGRIERMAVTSKTANRIQLESKTDRAGVRLDWDGKAGAWLIGAYDKEAPRRAEKFTGTLGSLWADMAPSSRRGENEDAPSTPENQGGEPAKPAYGASNKLVTADRAAELRERLKAKLRDQLNSGIDPEILAIGAELAVFHIEAGARRFADLAKAVANDLGTTPQKIRPYLRAWYNSARDLMEDGGASIDGMDGPDEVRAGLAALDSGELPVSPEAASDSFSAPVPTAEEVAAAAALTDPNPTDAQKEAENFRTGKIQWNGRTLSIENAKGSERSGTAPDGSTWSVKMPAHYGRILRTLGADGDHADFYMGDHPDSDLVVVVNQKDLKTGQFDEHKSMLGFETVKSALDTYKAAFSDGKGADRIKHHMVFTVSEFKQWLADEPVDPIDQAPVAAPETSKSDKEPKAKPAKIEDFGETIGGAKKDLWASYGDRMADAKDVDIAGEPLSKSWPAPDYEKMIEEGGDPWTVAFIHAARDEVPRKPTAGWKIKGWVQDVKTLREFVSDLLNGAVDKQSVQERIAADDRLRRSVGHRTELYLAVGHSASLQGLNLASASYSIRGGVAFNPAKTFWEVTKAQKATAFGNMPRVIASGDTKEEAISAFKTAFDRFREESESKAKEPAGTKFIIYSSDKRKTWTVGTKIRSTYIDLRPGLPDVAEARRILLEEQDKLQAEFNRMREIPNERRDENAPRVGIDHRDGGNVTPDQFSEAFGFRGVQFGNWVEDDRRQRDLNDAYDALMDLAGILDIPAKAISLNGSLGLAFGARGSGGKNPAAAHFEPGQVVINLTKRAGRGSLAHEWFHALDNYFAKQRRQQRGTYISDNTNPQVEGIRPEVIAAFSAVKRAIAATDLKKRSSNLDRMRSKDYWGTGIEMHARAFESYVIAKLQDQSAANDYLANIVDGAVWGMMAELSGLGDSFPYLKPDEIDGVRTAFDHLFNTIETRETDRGIEMHMATADSGHQTEFDRPITEEDLSRIASDLNEEVRRTGLTSEVNLSVVRELIGAATGLPIAGRARFVPDGTPVDVAVSVDFGPGALGALRHELIHVLRFSDLWGKEYGLFSAEEWRGLVAEARKNRDIVGFVTANYAHLDNAGQAEEMVAELYRRWAASRDRSTPQAKVLRRIMGFLEAVANVLRGRGFQSAASTMEKIARGDLGGRGPDGAAPRDSRGRFAPVPIAAEMRLGLNDRIAAIWNGERPDAPVVVGQLPPVLRALSGRDNTLVIPASVIRKAGSHGLTLDDVANAMEGLDDPVMVFDSTNETGNLTVLVETPAQDGRPMVVAVDTHFTAGKVQVSRIATIHGKNSVDSILGWMRNGFLRYINKGKAGGWSRSIGRQLPKDMETSHRLGKKILQHRDVFKAGPDKELRLPDVPYATTRDEFDTKERSVVSQLLTDAMGGKSPQYNLLGLVPGRALFAELGKALPGAQRYLRFKEEMDAMRGDWHQRTDTVAQEWHRLIAKDGKANQALMDLMHDATRAGVDPSSRFKAPERRKGVLLEDHAQRVRELKDAYSSLRPRFEALPKEFQKMFETVRDTYTTLADAFEEAVLANAGKAMKIGLERAERAYRDEMQRIKDEGLKGEAKADAEAVAAQKLTSARKVQGWGRNARLSQLRHQFESNRLDGPYFPLMRWGNYFVTVRNEEGKVVSFSRFESEKKQAAFVKEQKAAGFDVDFGVLDDKSGDLRQQVDPNFVADIEAIIGEEVGDSDVMDMVWQRWLETLPDFSVRRSRIHRKGTPGWDGDAFRAFGRQVFHGGHQLARLTYALDMEKALEDARREATQTTDPNRAALVVNEMDRRHAFTMNPTGSAVAQAINSAGFIYYLGVTPAAAVVNLTQTTILGAPILGAAFDKGGITRAFSALSVAFRDFVAGRGNTENSPRLKADEKAALVEAYRRGTIDKSQAHDLAGVAESGVEYSSVRMRVMKPISFLFHHAERLNREVTFLAAYRMAKDNGFGHDDAINKAADLTWKSHFDYQNTSRPRLMQNDTAKVLLLFRNFQVNMIWRLFRDIHQIFNGKSEADKKEARAQVVGITAMMMLHAGITGTWGYALLMTLAGLFFPGGSDDAEEELKAAIINTFGPGAGGLLLKGVPGHITGIDLTNRIGMPELWFRSSDRTLEGEDQYNYWLQQFLGAAPGMVENQFRGIQQIGQGETWRGVETMAPKFIRDLMKGTRFLEEGVTTMNGEPLIENVAASEAILQALGFSMARVSERYEANTRLKNKEQRITRDRQAILGEITKAMRDGEHIDSSMIDEVGAFNAANPDYPITNDTIMRSFRARLRAADEMEGGIRLNQRLNDRLREEAAPPIY